MKSRVFEIIAAEQARQNSTVELIASENFVSENVMKAVGSCLTNKYSEGYPAQRPSGNRGRFYGGCQYVDELEEYCCRQWQAVFQTDYHVNVQPHSGSSANLIAFMTLTAPELGDRQIRKGDEIITVACGFPTTVTPAIQYGAVPVFVDVTVPQYNIDVTKLEAALSPKTKAVMIAHTLGNPFDLSAVKAFCDAHNLWLVEDNCDALGTQYTINGETRFTGTWGDIGTSSFYPPHHMTMGEGGCVYTNNPLLNRLILSFRDWGRDCICPSGQDNFCGHRFDGQFGELPKGYDHKYVYSHFGYNLKVTDMQAAIGCEQLKKFPTFIERRRHNWDRLRAALEPAADKLILPEPAANSRPSWFGFLISVKPESGLDRNAVTRYVESHNVQTRLLFSGNLIKHPCFDQIRGTDAYRVAGELTNTDFIMNNTFWVGVYPGMTDEMIDYMAKTIIEAVNQ